MLYERVGDVKSPLGYKGPHDMKSSRGFLLDALIIQLLLTIILSTGRMGNDIVWAQDLGGSVLRDYPSALTLPKGRFEFSCDYLTADAPDNDSQTATSAMQAFRLLANYGLGRRTTIMSSWTHQRIDLGTDNLTIFSGDLAFKHNLIFRPTGWVPKLAIDAGIRTDRALGEDTFSVKTSTDNNQTGSVSIHDLEDTAYYARLTAGQILGPFFPHLFLEYGQNEINAKADIYTNEMTPDASTDLSRSETYLKTGLSLLLKFPYTALLHLEYDYLRLYRDQKLTIIDDNHFLRADFNYYLTPSLVLNLGGQYAFHQLNGQIPFLYQEANQDTFDKKYSCLQLGLTVLFGGRNQ
jgi:hypothetical protein